MQLLKAEVHRSKMNEYQRMAKNYGAAYNSTHEAYAVTKEEVEEVLEEIHDMLESLQEAWNCTRADVSPAAAYKNLEKVAQSAAAECVQVAACCYKALRSVGVVRET